MDTSHDGLDFDHGPELPVDPDRVDLQFGRRRFLAISGATVATAAVIGACGGGGGGTGIARVGNAPTTTALPAPDVNDVVLLRTASSLEHTIIDMYDQVLEGDGLVDEVTREYFTQLRENHVGHARTFETLTSDVGGEPWTCANPRLDTVVLTPVMRAIVGGAATDALAEMRPSDDPQRDVLTFAHAMESVATSTYQGLVATLSEPRLRQQSVDVATQVAAHAAALAIRITGAPEGYVTPEGLEQATGESTTTTVAPSTTQDLAAPTIADGATPPPPATPIPAVYAIPGQYGSLGATPLVVGAPDPETGNRLSMNLETPSLNTYVYEYLESCAADA
jgi:rubrerythrin